ncbi:hypothetical protein VaNZ11_002210 [Volvox africanus]|uniref:Uncharacterized protein n=1 Tax=Volvox africanus TaxID=51714 RepID=A0ABQ5RRE3_9CHLO|nr:hypothetical protein VaNZ11_002210 [Volvox africanus]
MLSAGRVQQQARHIWVALGCSRHIDAALSSPQEHSSSSFRATSVASGDSDLVSSVGDADLRRLPVASFSGRGESSNDEIGRRSSGKIHCVEQRTRTFPSASIRRSTSSIGLMVAPRWFASGVVTAFHHHQPGWFTPTMWTSGLISASPSRRMYHSWYYGTKLRNRVITSASSLDQLANLLRHEGDKLDHINLVVMLRQLQLLASDAARKTGPTWASAPEGSGKVAAAVAVASSRAVEQQVEALVARTVRLVRRRTKWYDPRNAAAVVHCTAALGYTDGRVLQNMTARTIARLNEAYSRDLLLLLQGLGRHARLSASPSLENSGVPAPSGEPAAKTTARAGTVKALRKPKYRGPPPQLLKGVWQFLLAKIPTGRMPPENIDGLMRYVAALPRNQRPLDRDLLTTVETDLRVRLSIYAPKPLAGVLHVLASERHPVAPDLLDAAADQFVVHADTYGTGGAAARFLTAASALIQDLSRRGGGSGGGGDASKAAVPGGGEGTGRAAAAGPTEAAGLASETASSSAAGGGDGKGLSPGRWLAGKPELLALCLKLMTRDLSDPAPNRLVDWMAVLIRSEVPLASLASAATQTTALGRSALATPPTAGAIASSPAPTANAVALPVGYNSTAVATAAAAFVKAHSITVEKVATDLSPKAIAKVRKMYDTYGLTYPKGL